MMMTMVLLISFPFWHIDTYETTIYERFAGIKEKTAKRNSRMKLNFTKKNTFKSNICLFDIFDDFFKLLNSHHH